MNRRGVRGSIIALAAAATVLAGLATPALAAGGPGPAGEAVPGSPTGLRAAAVVAPYDPQQAPGQPLPTVAATLPADLEDLTEYQGQAECTPAAKVGTQKLADLLLATYGTTDIGIDRDCSDGGQSEHKEGRAIDWMFSYKVPAERAKVEAFLWWLLKPDAQGHPAEMARRLGVMYMGWHDRFWASYRIDSGWTELKGCFSTPTADYDTYCHRDHLHISLSWDGAAGRTSFWGAVVDNLGACAEPDSGASALGQPLAATVTPITSFPLVRTRRGYGLDAPCRLKADRWDGDGRGLEIPVLGRGGVPATGVAAVRLRVGILAANAPTRVVASAAGSTSMRTFPLDGVAVGNSVGVVINGTKSGDVIAPVSTAGTVILRDLYGATDISVNVTGWVAAAPRTLVPPFSGSYLRLGYRRASVAAVQRALNRQGYRIPTVIAKTTPYGLFDAATDAAVRKYQADHGLAATGRVNQALYSRITGWVAPLSRSVSLALLLGGDDLAVRTVQQALNSVVAAGLTVDGQWGPRSQSAFEAYRSGVLKSDVTGPVDLVSLTALGRAVGFTAVA